MQVELTPQMLKPTNLRETVRAHLAKTSSTPEALKRMNNIADEFRNRDEIADTIKNAVDKNKVGNFINNIKKTNGKAVAIGLAVVAGAVAGFKCLTNKKEQIEKNK